MLFVKLKRRRRRESDRETEGGYCRMGENGNGNYIYSYENLYSFYLFICILHLLLQLFVPLTKLILHIVAFIAAASKGRITREQCLDIICPITIISLPQIQTVQGYPD